MQTLTHYLKRFGAWVTDLTDNYGYNPFTRAIVHVSALLLILAALLVLISGAAIQYAQNSTVGSINYHLQQAERGAPSATATLPQAINNVRNRTITYIFVGLIAIIALFGYLIVRFALSPTRESLNLQKRFIGNIAHEVRTPLAIMKTNTEVALMNPSLSPELQQTLNDTISELDRVSEIINNLLSFETLIRPRRVKTEFVDLGEVVKTVIGRHEALAASREIALSVQMGKHRFVMGNPSALEQVVTNLVKNALNYTPVGKGGTVHISIEKDYQGRVVLAVIDNGIGIAQKDLYRVFEPFYRGDTSRARGVGTGTSGLGLAIVNEIVRLHRGSISIKSAIGQGTTVAISLPPAPHSVESDEPLFTEVDGGINEVSVDFS